MSSERMDQSDKSTGGAGRPSSPRADSSSGSQDPDVLAAEIERTREDLAETLDEIADRVSPKRVASRGKQKLSDTVREKTAVAKEVVAEKTAVAKEVVAEKTAVAKERAATAQAAVSERAATAKGAVSDRVGQSGSSGGSSAASSVRLEQGAGTGAGSSAAAGVAASGAPGPGAEPLPPVTGVEVPALAPDRPTGPTAPLSTSATAAAGPGTGSGPSGGMSTWSTSGNPLLTPEALAGGAAALLGLWLLLRRRR